jgi:hypothetical protein
VARGQARSFQVDTHPARDDRALRTVCDDASMGRWDAPRDLIAATGYNWDRRVFRLQVLARQGLRLRWAETWATAEPDNPDALVMLAHVQALRAILADRNESQELADLAWQTTVQAADAAPPDPSPWLVLMALTRTLAPDGALMQELWTETCRRDPYSREGHHEMLAFLMPRQQGSSAMMFDWAHERTQQTPQGTPIPVVLLVAQAEHHQHRQRQSPRSLGVSLNPWADCPDIDRVLERWWHYRSPQPHANFADDANYLAYALCLAGRHAEAREVFEAIGPFATRSPWGFSGEAQQLFLQHRERALNPPQAPRWRRSN